MTRNASLASLAILVLAITFSLSSNISYAEDEHGSETEKTVATPIAEEHEETEEHSSHEDVEAKDEMKKESEHEHIREIEEGGSHVHYSATAEAAQWFGVGTLLVAAPVFGIRFRSSNKLAYKNVVLTLAVGVGIMHVLLAPDHLADVGVEHGIFFAAAGIAQIGFGLLFMARPTRMLATVGATGITGSIILYFVTRIQNLPEPFGAPEGIDPVGIIAKIAEMSLVALLIYLMLYLRKGKAVEIANAR